MIGQREAPQVSAEAFTALAILQQLTLETGLSENREQLTFRILNRSVAYCRYDRAVLWGVSGRRLTLLGVSGSQDVNQVAALASEWRQVVTALPNRDAGCIVGPGGQAIDHDRWEPLAHRTNGLSAIWLPISVEGRTVAGLWLERWGGMRFTDGDLARLESLALAYGIAWRSVARRPSLVGRLAANRKWSITAVAVTALLAALCLVRVPLRVVAPCEVVPRDPLAVTAPLAGVIDEVPVLPGRAVAADALLAVYDKRVALEELKVARQQVQISESDLQRSRVQAFDKPAARAEIALLENRLAQEKVRLRMAEHRVGQLEIRAPIAGTLMFADPNEWRGRPVQVGERLMLIVDPKNTKLRIWLPEADNIAFDAARSLTVVLDADPRISHAARLEFLANHSQISPDGVPSFRAEAEWAATEPELKLGLEGTAVLYGDDVALGYWLLRRPLAALRRRLGM